MGKSSNQPINVRLTLQDQGGASGWHMDIAGQGKSGPNGHPKAKVDYGSAADFQFVITGPGTQNVTFAAVNPLSIAPDNGSGKSPTVIGINTDQIVNVSVGGGKVLKFTDKNQDKIDLTYQLNFNGAVPLDPIIQNNGGGPPGFQYEYLIGALLLGLVALWMIRKVFWKTPATPAPIPNPPVNKPSVMDDEKNG